jgi:hypothetical protein
MAQDIVLTGIISYPTFFEPRQINGKGNPKFSGTLILDEGTDWNGVNACIQEALTAKFGTNIPPQWKNPIQPADAEGFPGRWLIRCYSDADKPPQVTDQRVQPVMDRSQIFAGCKVNLYVRFYGYSTSGNNGVGVGLNAVQIVDNVNVTRLDNTKDAKDVFQAIPGAPAQTAPTAYSQPAGQPPGAVPPGAPGSVPPPTTGPSDYPPQAGPGDYPPQAGPGVAAPAAGGPAVPPGPGAAAAPAAGSPSSPAPGAQPPGQPMPWET